MAKVGEEHLSAWARQGLRELRGALYPESNVAQQPEYGLYGTKTPGEVAQDRRGEGRDLEDEKPPEGESILASRLKQAEARGRDEPQRGMDRDR